LFSPSFFRAPSLPPLPLSQEEAQFTAAAASVTAELDRLAASSSELKARVDGAAAQVAARRAAASRAADAAAACRRQIASVEGQLERLRGARRDVVDAAAMDEVGLPAAGAPGRAARRRGGGAAAAMEVDAAAGGEEEDEEDEEEEPEEEEEGDAMEADGDGAGPSAAPAARTKRGARRPPPPAPPAATLPFASLLFRLLLSVCCSRLRLCGAGQG
jgi:hypothetical protein